MESKTKIIIVLSIIILILIFSLIYFVVKEYVKEYNNSIFIKGYNQGINDEIVRINQLGLIPIITFNNITGNNTIQEVSINTICKGIDNGKPN